MKSGQTHLLGAVAVMTSSLISASVGQLFTISCEPLTVFRGDPIVDFGTLSTHVHAVVGGTRFSVDLTNEQATQAKGTTCDKVLDKSNYWQPQLYHERRDGKFEIVEMQGIAGYYMSRTCDYVPGRRTCNGTTTTRAPPKGLRMLVGDPNLRTFNKSNPEQRAISHICLGKNAGDSPHLPTKQCDRMRAETFFPSCWDGKNVDSEDHKSHMAFPAIGDYNTGVCPKSHPFAILSVFLEFFYNTGIIKDFWRLVWAMGDPTGYGLHGDFVNGWSNQTALEWSMKTCTGPKGVNDPGCSLNVGPNGPGRASRQPLEIPPPTQEEVGLTYPLVSLPGDNPVTAGPICLS
ncbi:hypothetical protein E4U21_006730 [Claviceps maximensis]|nr:hypothetical protein E4U21_006730 [Claviceps maximensis]